MQFLSAINLDASFSAWLGEIFAKIFGDNAWLATILISMIPMIELKGGILFGRNVDFWGRNALTAGQAYACGLAGGLIVTIILALLLKPVFDWLKKTKLFRRFALRFEKSVLRKADKAVKGGASEDVKKNSEQEQKEEETSGNEKRVFWQMLGVFCFVAVPLPLTGVWMGTAIGVFIGLKFWQTLIAAFCGNAVAGIIIVLVSEIFFDYLNIVFFILLVIVAVLIVVGIVKMVIDSRREKREGVKEEKNSDEKTTD